MKIWVDADACPRPIKEVLVKASKRVGVPIVMVANRPLALPRTALIDQLVVPQGMDVADDHIVDNIEAGDLVITADIPLAARTIERGAHALDPRGTMHTEASIGERLSVRDFMTGLREAGVQTGGPRPFDLKAKRAFANALDAFLARHAPRHD